MSITITLSRVADPATLEAEWTRLCAEAPHSFFQSWGWTGCLFAERFPDPILARATRDGETIGLALFNRRARFPGREILCLGETGDPVHDAPYIELNGCLLAASAPAGLAAALLRAARRDRLDGHRPLFGRHLVLSGVTDPAIAHEPARTQPAPYLDLAALRAEGREPMAAFSANTRQQLRRSLRAYAAQGPLAIQRAPDAATAHAWLDALALLHQQTWIGRGQQGAFGNSFFLRFHHALIDRAPIEILRISAGEAVIGYLYNFRHQGQVHAYQSGFDYQAATRHQKPGLTCHWLAIALHHREGASTYDFLAGADRYKRSLANASRDLYWFRPRPMPLIGRWM